MRFTRGVVAIAALAWGAGMSPTRAHQTAASVTQAPTAQAMLAPALKRARDENKAVFVDFGAKTWCVPCRKLRAFLTGKETAPILNAHYVILELTVWENRENAHLNNPGAEALMREWGFSGGIPFVAIVDPDRRVLATSITEGSGGYPGRKKGIDAFGAMLIKTAPRMIADERTTLTKWLFDHSEALGSLEGQVLDERGEPIPNATVALVETMYSEGQWTPAPGRRVTADANGRYVIPNVAPGSHRLLVDPPPSTPARSAAVTFYPRATRLDDAKPVELEPFENVFGLDITLARLPLARVSGTATTADGPSLAGGSLTLTNIDWPLLGYRTTARADGTFAVENVRPGRYNVWAQSRADGTRAREVGVSTLEITGSNLENVRLVTSPGTTLAGMLVVVGGVISDADRQAIRVAAVAVRQRPGAPAGLRQTPIDQSGRFEIAGTFEHRVIRVNDLPPGWIVAAIKRGDRDVTDQPIDVDTDGTIRDLQVLVRRGAEIAGTVTDSNSRPRKDGAVIVFAADASRRIYPSRFVRMAAVDGEGRFLVRGLPSGAYLVAAVESLPPNWDAPESLESLKPHATAATVSDGERVPLTLIAKGGE